MSTMSTMAENVIAAGSKNRPPMLERRTATTPATTRERTLDDLTPEEKIRKACDVNATNIILQGSELSLQERESKLYNEFDKFTSKKGETVHLYHLRFVKLINAMNTIGMTMRPLQVNTKFVNHLQLEWSKFVIDVKGNATGLEIIQNTKMLLQTNQRSFDAITTKVKVIWQGSVLKQRGYRIHNGERVDSGIDARALTTTAIFQMDNLDAFDSDCDEAPTTSVVFMANLSTYGLDVLS
ncbi:hypothetical protein Tco_0828305 [Tanacetum coccineum]